MLDGSLIKNRIINKNITREINIITRIILFILRFKNRYNEINGCLKKVIKINKYNKSVLLLCMMN